ncbi:pseudouridine-5'-phosphate glycosidase [Agromyces humatus]|nr:pseudouridine-5'-phosphate glycosidase [Agromyces humatus]
MQPEGSSAIRVGDEVRAAIEAGTPVLALESTILSHGLPRPRNLEVAAEAEQSVRAAGVVPATIGVIDGVAVVGLAATEIERLCTRDGVVKVSVRDLPIARAKRLDGGTTVAATAWLAHRAGIAVMSTGGLGGVHRGASETFDESADLTTLAQTPITLVSAGVKSILDIGATLERLETLNVPVVGYRTNDYPGFYVADSGFALGYRVDTAAEAAALARARDELGLSGAVLVANPIDEASQLDPEFHDRVLAEALAAASAAGITGHDTTPFLLDHMQRATGGRSLDVNLDVYRGNVALGAEIARALAG